MSAALRRILLLAGREWRVTRPQILSLVVLQPLIVCAVWGCCAVHELRTARVGVLDLAGDAAARRARRALRGSGSGVLCELRDRHELEQALRVGRIDQGLILRRGPRGLDALLVADGSDPTVVAHARRATLEVLRRNGVSGDEHLEPPGRSLRAGSLPWFNPGLSDTAVSLVTALAFSLIWLSHRIPESFLAPAERRARRVLRLSFLRPAELWLSLIGVQLLLGVTSSLLLLALVGGVFGLPRQGDLSLLLGGLALMALTHLNLGITVARWTGSRAQASLLVMVLLFACMCFSGLLVPVAGMPPWAQAASAWVPLRHASELCRELYFKGNAGAGGPLQILAAFALGSSALAIADLRSMLRRGL